MKRQRCGQEVGMIRRRHKTQYYEPVSVHNHEVQICSPDGFCNSNLINVASTVGLEKRRVAVNTPKETVEKATLNGSTGMVRLRGSAR